MDFHRRDQVRKQTLNTILGTSRWKRCKKNPGHKDLIPVKEFGLDDLPKEYRKKKIMRRIQLVADLSCRLTVCHKSSERSKDNLLFGEVGEQRLASGTVIRTRKTKLPNQGMCKHCNGVHELQEGFYVITIMTACHVVFDCREAESTTVDLFYDDEITTTGIKRLQGFQMISRNINEDRCVFECTTRDVALVELLEKKLIKLKKLSKSILPTGSVPCEIIAFHPHGLSKHISVGVQKDKDEHETIINSGYFHRNIRMTFSEGIAQYVLFPSMDPIIVSNTPDSEFVGIECEVHFPDLTSQKCHLWKLDAEVQCTKSILLLEAGVLENPDNFYLELILPNEESQIMKDDKYLDYYIDDIIVAYCIHVKRKNEV